MAKDKFLFIISFVCIGLLGAFLFRHKAPPPPPAATVEKPAVEVPAPKELEVLPPNSGKIIVPFQLTTRSSIAQFLVPGSLVDIRFTSKSNLGLDTISLMLLMDIRVLGLGKDSEGKNYNEKGVFYKPNNVIEILLEMTPKEAEIFSYAEGAGTITLEIAQEGITYPDDPLKRLLLSSQSNENFNSIITTHMIQSLFPESHIKVISISKGYIVTGEVKTRHEAENIIKILSSMAPNGEKGVVNLLQVELPPIVEPPPTVEPPPKVEPPPIVEQPPIEEKVEAPKEPEIEVLPPNSGKIIVPFQLTTRASIAQFLAPGSLVDIRFTSKSNLGLDTISLMLLTDIRVLGIGKDTSGKNYYDLGVLYKSNNAIEILLEMTPKEAEIFSYAEGAGNITLEIAQKGITYPDDPLKRLLFASKSDENFNSILTTHMIQSLFPDSHIKVISISKGYIVTGEVNSPHEAESIVKILSSMASNGEKGVVNLLQIMQTQAPQAFHPSDLKPCRRAVSLQISLNSPVASVLHTNSLVNVRFISREDFGIRPVNLVLLTHARVLGVHQTEIVLQQQQKPPIRHDEAHFNPADFVIPLPHPPVKPTEIFLPPSPPHHEEVLEVFLEMSADQAQIFEYAKSAGFVTLDLEEPCKCENNPEILEDLARQLLQSHSLVEFQSILVSFTLHTLFPNVDVSVLATPRGFVIEGLVPEPQIAAKIMEVFEKLVPGGNKSVVNMLDTRPQQVLLKVKFYEVSPSFLSRVGINWHVIAEAGGQLLGFGAVFPPVPANAPNYFFEGKSISKNWDLSALIDMLEEDAYTKVLAEPNLTTVSGETAHFFAGGEFPIIIPQGGTLLGTVTVEFKKFGVSLDFTPIVDLNGLITLHVVPEVSDIDRNLSTVLNGFVIPGMRSRKTDTVVKLWPGQSYIISGLYLDEISNTSDNLYGLNNVPFFGSLFGSNHYEDKRNELLFIVTPYLVHEDPPWESSENTEEVKEQSENLPEISSACPAPEPEFMETSWDSSQNIYETREECIPEISSACSAPEPEFMETTWGSSQNIYETREECIPEISSDCSAPETEFIETPWETQEPHYDNTY